MRISQTNTWLKLWNIKHASKTSAIEETRRSQIFFDNVVRRAPIWKIQENVPRPVTTGICLSLSIASTTTEREGPLPLTFGGLHFCGATQARGKAKRRKGRKLLENSPDEQAYAAAYPDMIRGAVNYKCLLVTET
nr:PREDICTED: uncharacterized protein LOC108951552 [Musa acuminata subsp. malaccensis]